MVQNVTNYIMAVDKSKMGLTFGHPRVSRVIQEQALRNAGAEWILHVGILPQTWMEVSKIVREGDTVFIYAGAMVPMKHKAIRMALTAQWASFLTEVHSLGGHIVEASTGRTTADLKQQRAINADTVRLLKIGGKRLPATGRGAGRPPRLFTDAGVLKAKTAWFSKDYATNEIAERHMPNGFTVTMARRKWGPSGRPWKKTRRRRSTKSGARTN